MIKTAADFTMYTEGTTSFNWMDDGIDSEVVNSVGVEEFVRGYAKSTIAAWSGQVEVKASDKTIYKVWRASGEFEALCAYVRDAIGE